MIGLFKILRARMGVLLTMIQLAAMVFSELPSMQVLAAGELSLDESGSGTTRLQVGSNLLEF